MRDWRYVSNHADFKTGGLQRTNRRFAARARTFNGHLDQTHAVLHCSARCSFGCRTAVSAFCLRYTIW